MGGVYFLPWISITLSSEAQAFGHGFSWGHWNAESDYKQINEVIKTFIYSTSKRITTKLWLTYRFCCNILLPWISYILLPIRTTGVLYIPPHLCGIGPSKRTMQWALMTCLSWGLCSENEWPTPAEQCWPTRITRWHSNRLTRSPSRAETQDSDASQIAVRSWPPSSAITTRPPARPMSSWVSCPKPANAQSWRSRNTSQHSTIMSKKCCGCAHIWQRRCILPVETGDPPLRRNQQTPEPHLDWNAGQWASPHTCTHTRYNERVYECILHTSSQSITCFILLFYIFSDSRNVHFWCIPKGIEVLHVTHRWLHPSSPCYVYIKTIASTWPHLQRHRMATAYYSLPLFVWCCCTCCVMRARMGI